MWWGAAAVERVPSSTDARQDSDCAATYAYAESAALPHLVPSKSQLTGFIRVMYATVVAPNTLSRELIMQQHAG